MNVGEKLRFLSSYPNSLVLTCPRDPEVGDDIEWRMMRKEY